MKNTKNTLKSSLKNHYILINIIIAGIISMIWIYSGIFSSNNDNYPVKCIHYQMTGEKCETCGLSHSFSSIIRGNFSNARQLSKYGIPIFLFFMIQFIIRITTTLLIFKFPDWQKRIAYADIIISVILYIFCFKNLILSQIL